MPGAYGASEDQIGSSWYGSGSKNKMAGNCCIVVCSMDLTEPENKCKCREHGNREFTGEKAVETEEETERKENNGENSNTHIAR